MAFWGLRKTYFFPHLKACERRNFDFVCSNGCVVSRLHCYGKWQQTMHEDNMTLHIRKNTQKSKFLLSQAFKWGKKYVFRSPRDAI